MRTIPDLFDALRPEGESRLALTLKEYGVFLANLVPIIGVIILGWSAAGILVYYWLENVVIGLATVAKMMVAREDGRPIWTRPLYIAFFMLHYGLFCFGHLSFIFMMLSFSELSAYVVLNSASTPEIMDKLFGVSWPPATGWEIAAIIISLGSLVVGRAIVFYQDFIKSGRYKAGGNENYGLLVEPYPRIILLHLALMFGFIPVFLIGLVTRARWTMVFPVVILIVVKTCMELVLDSKNAKHPVPVIVNTAQKKARRKHRRREHR